METEDGLKLCSLGPHVTKFAIFGFHRLANAAAGLNFLINFFLLQTTWVPKGFPVTWYRNQQFGLDIGSMYLIQKTLYIGTICVDAND